MAREGYRFKAGRDEQTLRMIHRRIAHEIGGGFDRVGPMAYVSGNVASGSGRTLQA